MDIRLLFGCCFESLFWPMAQRPSYFPPLFRLCHCLLPEALTARPCKWDLGYISAVPWSSGAHPLRNHHQVPGSSRKHSIYIINSAGWGEGSFYLSIIINWVSHLGFGWGLGILLTSFTDSAGSRRGTEKAGMSDPFILKKTYIYTYIHICMCMSLINE